MHETKVKKLSDLKPADYNPRIIEDKALEGLKYSIDEFGDISGITFNVKTGNLVCAHQRKKALLLSGDDYNIEIIERYNEPTEKGTTAHGFIDVNGERFSYREVEWDLNKEKAANIAANNQALHGYFTSGVKLEIESIQLDNPSLYKNLLINEIEIPIDVTNVLPASESEQGRLDERSLTKCPECGHEFKPKA